MGGAKKPEEATHIYVCCLMSRHRNYFLTHTLYFLLFATTTKPMVEVIAPATLPAQYVFPAMVGNQAFLARVPPGGIQQGQRFSVPLPMKQQGRTKQEQQYVPPIGYWKDGFSDFFRFGVFHPTVWNSCCCTMSE